MVGLALRDCSPLEAADHHVGLFAGELHLKPRLLPNYRLVEQNMVENVAESIVRVEMGRGVFNGLADGDAQTTCLANRR